MRPSCEHGQGINPGGAALIHTMGRIYTVLQGLNNLDSSEHCLLLIHETLRKSQTRGWNLLLTTFGVRCFQCCMKDECSLS